jgi:hypothetical protein
MKNSKSVVILFLSLVILYGCNKKSSNGVSPALVGKWKDGGTKGSITLTVGVQSQTEPLDDPGTGSIIEFKADGTVTESNPSDGFGFTKYKTSGSQIIFTILDQGKTYDFTFNYNISGSVLTLTMDKTIFLKNLDAVAAAGVTDGFADLIAFKSAISAITYTQTFNKQ